MILLPVLDAVVTVAIGVAAYKLGKITQSQSVAKVILKSVSATKERLEKIDPATADKDEMNSVFDFLTSAHIELAKNVMQVLD